jgi:7,8-dihydropterin-6-yl-methyl-4-(beta-D-ribofuranosyl)aminobenzene 5'-phosphate synthase
MNIITLIENSREKKSLDNEWGLSLYVEANERRILFDTGMSSAFVENAKKLDVDLSKVDMVVLSHGHFDHGGGLAAFFSANGAAPLYLRTTADDNLYGKFLVRKRYVGLDRALLESNKTRLRWVEEDTEIAPGLHILTSIPDTERRPDTRSKILVKTEHGFVPDAFKHELVFVVKEKDGMSVITGCGHLGILNMVLAAKRKFPGTPIKAVIGGFHTISNPITERMAATLLEMKAMALRFKELGCQRVISGHCTGKKAASILKEQLGQSYFQLSTGTTFEIRVLA